LIPALGRNSQYEQKNGEEKVKLNRIARIDAEIRSDKYPNSEELAAKLEVSPRTIL
jgi:hypothetical protein